MSAGASTGARDEKVKLNFYINATFPCVFLTHDWSVEMFQIREGGAENSSQFRLFIVLSHNKNNKISNTTFMIVI